MLGSRTGKGLLGYQIRTSLFCCTCSLFVSLSHRAVPTRIRALTSPMIRGRKLHQKRVVLMVAYCMRHRSASRRVGQSRAHREIKVLYSACFLLCVTLFPNTFSSWLHDSDSCLFCVWPLVLPKCASATAGEHTRSIILDYWQGGSETDSGKGQLTVNVCQGTFSSQQSGFSDMSHAYRNCR